MTELEEFIRQAKDGNLYAFEQLIEYYIPTIERFSFQCGVPLDQIEDITQEVCIKVFRFLHQYDNGKFTTWLYKVTLNVIRDYYRQKQTTQTKMKFYQKELASSLNFNTFQFQFDDELHNAISALEDSYKIPLILFYFHELTYKEIGTVLNISMPNVKLRLLRAKKKLKKNLEGKL